MPSQNQGVWHPGFNHSLPGFSGLPHPTLIQRNAIHMSQIPATNDVIVWGFNGYTTQPGSWRQEFSVVTPATPGTIPAATFKNYRVSIPAGYGDIGCAGHTWLPDGRLFVAGGTTIYPAAGAVPEVYHGSQFVGIWDPTAAGPTPDDHGWDTILMGQLAAGTKAMHLKRWYPTVLLISDRLVMVAGGTERTDYVYCTSPDAPANIGNYENASNTFELFDLFTGDWIRPLGGGPPKLFNGPSGAPGMPGSCTMHMALYPRMHLVSTNHVALVGEWPNATQVRPDPSNLTTPQVWTPPVFTTKFRGYGTTVLLPNVSNSPGGRDLVMQIGGWNSGPILGESLILDCSIGSGAFGQGTPETMFAQRMLANAVLLPDGQVLVVGGTDDNYYISLLQSQPQLQSEIYSKQLGWRQDASQASERMYHSTAVLLTNGRVLSAGGDKRASDYEIYDPPYMTSGQALPVFTGAWAASGVMDLIWDTPYEIDFAPLPAGVTVQAVVLMRPGSVTHHQDYDQRYVELSQVTESDESSPTRIVVKTPKLPDFSVGSGVPTNPGRVEAMPGHYMAFLVTSQGRPSQAKWVKL